VQVICGGYFVSATSSSHGSLQCIDFREEIQSTTQKNGAISWGNQCVCVCVRARACARVCVWARVCAAHLPLTVRARHRVIYTNKWLIGDNMNVSIVVCHALTWISKKCIIFHIPSKPRCKKNKEMINDNDTGFHWHH